MSDALINLRQFVGGLDRVLNDQSYGGFDGTAYNPTGQFASVGPYGTSAEGRPIALTSAGGLQVSPAVLLIAVGFGVAYLLRRA